MIIPPPSDKLMWALLNEELDVAEAELKRGVNPNGKYLVDEATGDQDPILFFAAKTKCGPDAVEMLLDYGANVDARRTNGDTLLLELVGCGNQDLPDAATVRLLLERGADLNAKDRKGLTPLDRAVRMAARMFENPRHQRCEESPDLVVSQHLIRLLQANGGRMSHESAMRLKVFLERAKRELRIQGMDRGRD